MGGRGIQKMEMSREVFKVGIEKVKGTCNMTESSSELTLDLVGVLTLRTY